VRSLLIVAVLLSTACKLSGPAVSERCEHTGDRCQLDQGLQGVCTPTDQPTCATPPCLACTPQH